MASDERKEEDTQKTAVNELIRVSSSLDAKICLFWFLFAKRLSGFCDITVGSGCVRKRRPLKWFSVIKRIP